jgi:integrase/recombinase XerD
MLVDEQLWMQAFPRLRDEQKDNVVLRFQEKGGKSREIPVRHDLEGYIRADLEAGGISEEAKDRPLFRVGNGRSKELTGYAMDSRVVCDLVKRRLKDAGLPRMFNIWPGMKSRERPGCMTDGRRR